MPSPRSIQRQMQRRSDKAERDARTLQALNQPMIEAIEENAFMQGGKVMFAAMRHGMAIKNIERDLTALLTSITAAITVTSGQSQARRAVALKNLITTGLEGASLDKELERLKDLWIEGLELHVSQLGPLGFKPIDGERVKVALTMFEAYIAAMRALVECDALGLDASQALEPLLSVVAQYGTDAQRITETRIEEDSPRSGPKGPTEETLFAVIEARRLTVLYPGEKWWRTFERFRNELNILPEVQAWINRPDHPFYELPKQPITVRVYEAIKDKSNGDGGEWLKKRLFENPTRLAE